MPITPEPDYFNTFDASKRYWEVRALAGSVDQSQEDNIIQSIAREMIKRLSDFLFSNKNGTVLSGGGYSRQTADDTQLDMEAATFYYNGIIHVVDAKTLTVTNTDTEVVGIKVTESIVTPTIAALAGDTSLYDPAIGETNEGFEGANRLKIECTWEVDAVGALPVYTFIKGVQQQFLEVARIDPVVELLEKRTYDESGNYVVSGFNVDAQAIGDDSGSEFNIVIGNFEDTDVTGSTAYVQGQQIIQIVPQPITVSKATEPRLVERESYTFSDEEELVFPLNSQPLAADGIESVYATFGVLRTITGHAATDTVPLITGDNETLVDILRVYSDATSRDNVEDPDTVYLEAPGTGGPGAWRKSGNTIRWDIAAQPTSTYDDEVSYGFDAVVSYSGTVYQSKTAGNYGNEPGPSSAFWQVVSTDGPSLGDSYYVYMTVKRPLAVDEYAIGEDGNSLDISSINAMPFNNNLVTGEAETSELEVDYRYYLSRIDVPYLTSTGTVAIAQGSYSDSPTAPNVEGGTLPLAEVLVSASNGAMAVTITPYNNKRMTMLELRRLQERVDRQEYNQAILDLNNNALSRASNSNATLRGILTEAFTYTVDDLQKNKNLKFVRTANTTSDDCINVSARELSLPENHESKALSPSGSYDGGSTTITRDEAGTYLAEAIQPIKTNTIRINAYDGFIAPPLIALSKSVGTSEYDNTTLATYNPTNPKQVIKNFVTNWAADPTERLNQANFISAGRFYDFMKPEWIWIYGTGYPANALVEIRFDGRGVYMSNTVPTMTYEGSPADSGLGAWPTMLGQTTRPLSTLVTYTGAAHPLASATLLDTKTIFTNVVAPSGFVKTDSTGKFGTAILVPEGVAAGVAAVTASAINSQEGAAQATFSAGHAVKTTDTTWIVYDEFRDAPGLVKPPAPVITALEILNGTTGLPLTGGDFTGTQNMMFRVKWDTTKGGTPSEVLFTITTAQANFPQESRAIRRTRAENPGDFTVAGEATYTVPISMTEGFVVDVTARNVTGTSNGPLKMFVSRQGVSSTAVEVSVKSVSLGPICRGGSSGQKVNIVGGKNIAYLKFVNYNGSMTWSGTIDSDGTGTYLVPSATPKSFNINVRTGNGYNNISLVAYGPDASYGTAQIKVPEFDAKSSDGKPKVDPLSEVFLSNREHDMLVESVAVSFATKPNVFSEKGVTLEIREVDAGVPSRRKVTGGVATKDWNNIVTNDGTTDANTEFVFDGPVLLRRNTFYAIVLITESQDYTVHIGTLGGVDLITGTTVEKQAYQEGTLLKSANDLTWTAVPESDLYFKIKAKSYDLETKPIEFAPITGSNMVGFRLEPTFMLINDPASTIAATEIVWRYTQDDEATPIPFSPYSFVYFPNSTADSITISCELISHGAQADKISPLLVRADIEIQTLTRELEAVYVSKALDMSGSPYSRVRMIAKMSLPTSNQTAEWYISDNTEAPTSVPTYSGSANYAIGSVVSNGGYTWLALASNGPATTVVAPTQGATWTQAQTTDNVVWRIVPSAGQLTSLQADGVFTEYERNLTLAEDDGRDKFRFMIKLKAASAADTLKQPRYKDAINILND